MRMGGLTKLGTLGRGPMKQLTTCLSVFVLEMAKGSGLANLWVSKPPALQASILSLSIWIVQVTKCQYEAAYNQILTHTVMYIDCAIWQKLNYVVDDCKYLPTVQTQGGYVTCLLFWGSSSGVYFTVVMVGSWVTITGSLTWHSKTHLLQLASVNPVSSPYLKHVIFTEAQCICCHKPLPQGRAAAIIYGGILIFYRTRYVVVAGPA